MNFGTGKQVILLPLQLAAVALTAFYMLYRWSGLHARNQRTWDEIVGRLSPAWNGAGSVEADKLPLATSKLWTAYRDAGVIMELADYAHHHGRDFDASSVQELRVTALCLRFTALKALAGRISLR